MSSTARSFPAEYRPFPDVARRNRMQERVEVPLLISLLRLPKGGDVLEVGCGRGVALPVIAERLQPRTLVGLDVDAGMIDIAEARLEAAGHRIELRLGDVRALPFDDHEFDLVFDFGTCHHIARADAALREIYRVLRPGGLFVSETVTSQLLSHPWRTRGARLPWDVVPGFRVLRGALLWKVRQKDG